MTLPPSNSWHDGMRVISYCPLCEEEFNPMEARILSENGQTHLLHVRCRHCSNALLALVLVTKGGVSSVGLVTDLSYDDVVKFQSAEMITADEVIQLHQSLESGDLLRKVQ